MKKLLIGILIPVFVLALSATGVAYAQEEDTDQVGLTMTQFEMLLELLDALNIKLDRADLQDKLVRQDLRDDVREIRDFAMDMYEGITSEEVTDLQEILSGYSDIYPEGIVSGYFGPLTKQAVKRFQKKLGIDDTGYVGPLTRRALNDLMDDGEITAEEAAMMPAGIQKGYALGKPLPPGIWKNLQARRGFAKGLNYGWDDGNDDSDDEYNKEDADEAIKDAQDAIDEAQSEIDEAIENDEDAELVEQAEGLLGVAQDKFDAAELAFEDENWEDAETLAEEAEDLAEQAEELFEDDSDDDDDDSEDDDDDDSDDDE